jgi:hypothetical protein
MFRDKTPMPGYCARRCRSRVLADHIGVGWLMLADLAAGIDDAVGDSARVAGTGVDNGEGVAEPAAMRAFCFGHEELSPFGAGVLLTA